jgi:hypothetical protein
MVPILTRCLPCGTDSGELRLEALCGSPVFVGIEGEQMIGVVSAEATIGHHEKSFSPIGRLLEGIKSVTRMHSSSIETSRCATGSQTFALESSHPYLRRALGLFEFWMHTRLPEHDPALRHLSPFGL